MCIDGTGVIDTFLKNDEILINPESFIPEKDSL